MVDFVAGGNTRPLAAADIDGDGRPDLAVANFSGAPLSLVRNTVSSLAPPAITSFSPPVVPGAGHHQRNQLQHYARFQYSKV